MGNLTEERRRILEMVAGKEVSPDEAAALLAELERDRPAIPPEIEAEGPVNAIKVVGTFKTLRVEGDRSIATAVVEGPHRVRSEGGTMIVQDEADGEEPGYMMFGGRGVRFSGSVGGRKFEWMNRPPAVKVRMNPSLPLEIELTAGSLRVEGIDGPIRADLTAGSARFEGVRAPFRAGVDAGALRVSGLFDSGLSEIRCTAGKVSVELDPRSDVRIRARSTLGRITLPDGVEWHGIGGGEREVTIGEGKGTLDLEATTGRIAVEVR